MKRLETYDTYSVPVHEIYVDPDFNCRGTIMPNTVKSLADDIHADGLAIPVILQRREDSQIAIPPQYKFRLVAGFRRYLAITLFLKWPEIPANVRPMTDDEAETLNFTENLQRQDLNPLEEARAIQRRYPNGVTLKEASNEFKRDTRWVHQRLRVLQLPEVLQQKVAARILSLLDVEQLSALPPERQIEAADEIIAAKRGEGKTWNSKYRRKFRSRRSKLEVNQRLEQLLCLGFEGLVTRFGAWFCGYISDEEFDADIRQAAVKPRRRKKEREFDTLDEWEAAKNSKSHDENAKAGNSNL
jgi:ParB/RepB/Spo0J family partition protein